MNWKSEILEPGKALFLSLVAASVLAAVSAGAQEVPSRTAQIVAANSMDLPGKTPFHLKIDFEMFDLEGKPSDTGSIEEWWSAPGVSRVLVLAHSMNSSEPVPFDGDLQLDPREKYLLSKLLYSAVRPLSESAYTRTISVHEEQKTFSKVKLDCLDIGKFDPSGGGRAPETFCVDQNNNALRVQYAGQLSSTVRNRVGVFHGTNVSLDLQLAFEQRTAISGKVTVLQSWQPAKADAVSSAVQAPPGDSVNPALTQKPLGGVVAGRIKSRVSPSYPAVAKVGRVEGTVLLHAIISKQGRVTGLFPIASPSQLLTAAAMEAVKQWTYTPYLLNGQPTEVDTEINVNFNLGGV